MSGTYYPVLHFKHSYGFGHQSNLEWNAMYIFSSRDLKICNIANNWNKIMVPIWGECFPFVARSFFSCWNGVRDYFCAAAVVALAGLLPGWVGSKSWPAGCISFFRLVGCSAVVLMLGLMDLFATAFISFTSKNWQAVKWNFGLDFQLDCLETFVKIFCFCVAAASSTVIVLKGRKVIYCTDFLE